MADKKSWQAIALDAQRDLDASISHASIQPPVPDVPSADTLPLNVMHMPRELLTPDEVWITELAPGTLAQQLSSGALSAVSVTKAYLRRAGIAQKLANCLVELLPERALARAAELDAHMDRHGEPVGPLHGVPISVKEHISMAGRPLSLGYVARYGDLTCMGAEEALPLQLLARAGAVLFARTTEPQSLMHLECSSNLYGVTVNPHNRGLSSGGSSGGEGALVALRGSCLGIGTDIGGSIRSPAGNCGVYGLRPTAHRLPYTGVEATVVAPGGILPVQGPISSSVAGLRMYCQALLGASPAPWVHEPAVVPLPWRDHPIIRRGDKVRIGVMYHDGVVKPHPPIVRALREVVDQLKKLDGVQIVDFTRAAGELQHYDEGWEIISSLYYADGADGEREQMDASAEPMRPLTKWLLDEEGHVKRLPIEKLWGLQVRREQYVARYNQAWLDTGGEGGPEEAMDVLLCPYSPGASSVPDTARYWAYTSTWNLVDYPAMVFPVSKADPEVDKVEPDFKAMSDQDKRNHELYEPETFRGAPVSLQLVARRFEEEKLLAIADFIIGELGLPFVSMK